MTAAPTPRPSRSPRRLRRPDGAGRRRRQAAGLDGVLVTPGPDLVWLTGYQPTAITERLTMLVLTTDREPTLLVPTLERPDAEAAEGTPATSRGRLDRRHRPVRRGEPRCCAPTGATASPTAPGRCTCSASRRRCRGSAYHSLTQRLPMLRAVKDANELARLEAAGAAADATYGEILERALRRAQGDRGGGRPGRPAARATGTSRSTSRSSAPAPTARTRTTRPATGSSRSATASCSTSAA